MGADNLNAATVNIVTVESVFDKNEEFEEVMEKMPDYTFTMQQQSDVSSYIIKET